MHDVASKSKPRDDETDEAKVILYFIRPDPIFILAVAIYIRIIQKQQQKHAHSSSSSLLILTHRVVIILHSFHGTMILTR